jgi:hypothetical protein
MSQKIDFCGWPDAYELPIDSMTQEHKAALISECSREKDVPMPDFAVATEEKTEATAPDAFTPGETCNDKENSMKPHANDEAKAASRSGLIMRDASNLEEIAVHDTARLACCACLKPHVVKHTLHDKHVLNDTRIQHVDIESNRSNLTSVLAVLAALTVVVMADDRRKVVLRKQRLYMKSLGGSRISKFLTEFGDSFINDVAEALENAGYETRFFQLYFALVCCTSHQDDRYKVLVKCGGSLDFTNGRDTTGKKVPALTINCEKGLSVIDGTKSGAMTGRNPETGEATGVFHQNHSEGDLPSFTVVGVDKNGKPGDMTVLVPGVEKAAVRWNNGDLLARIIAAINTAKFKGEALTSNDAVREAMEPRETDFDTPGRPTRSHSEEEEQFILKLYPELQELLRVIQEGLKPFSPNSFQDDEKFNKMLKNLDAFKVIHKHCVVRLPNGGKRNKFVLWVDRMRTEHKKWLRKEDCSGMSAYREKELKSRNFCFDLHEFDWLEMYNQLKEYTDVHDECPVPYTGGDPSPLETWFNNQRTRRESMPRSRKDLLDALGFIWDVNAWNWEQMYNQLKEYNDVHGHCGVPYTRGDPSPLGKWVDSQRTRRESMPRSRRDLLDTLGFIWDVNAWNWEQMYNQLKEYNDVHGHCGVPYTRGDPSPLGKWVDSQRSQQESMPRSRRDLLDTLGFIWDVNAWNWERKYEKLVVFAKGAKDKNGNPCIPSITSGGPNSSLAIFIQSQQRKWRTGKMPKDQKKKLDALGVSWPKNKKAGT